MRAASADGSRRFTAFLSSPTRTPMRLGPSPQWLYCIRFSGAEIWGRDGDPDLDVSIDAWESYLEGFAE